MLRVTVECLPPWGGCDRLAVMEIVNDGSGDAEIGNYRVNVAECDGDTASCEIKGHRRDNGFWSLVGRAIEGLG